MALNVSARSLRGQPSQILDEQIKRYVGLSVIVSFEGLAVTNELRSLLRDYYVGNVILGPENFYDAAQTARLTRDLQGIAQSADHAWPLLLGVEQQGGLVSPLSHGTRATQFPSPLSLAATGSISHTQEIGEAIGKELTCLGLNWDIAPRIDRLTDVTEPLDASRTFGDDTATIGRHALSFSQGLRAVGIVSCAAEALASSLQQAHRQCSGFPELDPDEQEELSSRDFSALRALATAQCLDTVRLASSGYDAESSDMFGKATQLVISEGIRTHLAFEGPVISDCLPYDTAIDDPPPCVQALSAGADMVTLPGDTSNQIAMIEAIYTAISASTLPTSTITASGTRVATLKSRFLSWQRTLQPPTSNLLPPLFAAHASLARTAYRASTTIFPPSPTAFSPLTSLTPSSLLLLLTPAVPPLGPTSTSDPFEPLGRALNTLHPTLRIRHVPYTLSAGLTGAHTAFLRRADAVVLVLCNNSSAFVASLQEFVETVMVVWAEREREGPVVVGMGDPRDLVGVRAVLGGRGGALGFEYTGGALEAVAEVVMGRRGAGGRVPVRMG